MSNPPNIIFLTVDALRADRTTLSGYDRPTTPSLERIAKNGLNCKKCYSLGPTTQTAMIQLLTSSRPFSFGGYDDGAVGRPPTVFKVFSDAGYHTSSLTTLHWVNEFFGYNEGVDEECQMYGIITLPGVAFALMKGTLKAYEIGVIDEEETVRHIEPVLTRLFSSVIIYCEKFNIEFDDLKREFPDSMLMNANYDYHRILEITRRHEAEFNTDKFAYIDRYLLPAPEGESWMRRWLAGEWYYARKKSKLLEEAIFRTGNKLLSLFCPDHAQARKNRFKIYPDARSISNKTIDVIKSGATGQRPFFVWTHFMDTHLPYVSGAGRNWYREVPEYLRRLGYDSKIPPARAFSAEPTNAQEAEDFSALYDAAVVSTDHEIGRILDTVTELGLEENTIIAISGDHGEELGEFGHFGHFFRLNRVASHVPCIISGPGIKAGEMDTFSTTMDIAPTLADAAGIPIPPDWEGRSLLASGDDTQENVMLETFHSGNCLFEHRPLYFAIRNQEYYFIWRETIDPADRHAKDPRELYDLSSDPDEKINIYDKSHPAVAGFEKMIARRMAEIPEISEERLGGLFPQ